MFIFGRKSLYLLVALTALMIAILLLLETGDSPATSHLNPTNSTLTSTDIPILPFPENPDPTLCGIPTVWGSANNWAWLTGVYNGVMVEPIVYLYDSHLRRGIKAQAPHGTQVKIVLFQANPVLDYYMVQIPDAAVGQSEGWAPAPFVSFAPVGETVRRFG
ncbi:MAG: hypothetical protein HY862_09740 [Chloroflexi bacterium]|nr:hypothetical protein [Chloroflexota bacterium]